MKIIEPSFEILTKIDGQYILSLIELIGRTAYKSENKITKDSAKKFVEMIIRRGHESVIEHFSITVKFICDRGISHEIVRHRIASYTQESSRFCNYSKNRFNNSITVIRPEGYLSQAEYEIWKNGIANSEKTYFALIEKNIAPEIARGVLPIDLKTEVVMTANLREWRHFFKMRTNISAHPKMRELTIPLLKEFKKQIPIIFNDIEIIV